MVDPIQVYYNGRYLVSVYQKIDYINLEEPQDGLHYIISQMSYHSNPSRNLSAQLTHVLKANYCLLYNLED